MSTKKTFVNNGETKLGPYEFLQIIEMVTTGSLKATDYMYLDDRDDWIMICQHPDFSKTFETAKQKKAFQKPIEQKPAELMKVFAKTTAADLPPIPPQQKPTKEKSKNLDGERRWYLFKDKKSTGPFAYFDIIKSLQDKSTFEFDFIWCESMDTWHRIAELPEFSKSKVREVLKGFDKAEIEEIFYRRRHDRSDYKVDLLIHDNNRLWKGETFELSSGGAGVVMKNAALLPGQHLYVHFKPGNKSAPFNVLCEVVSKKFIKGVKDRSTPIIYGLKFVNLQRLDSESIKAIASAA